MVHEQFPFMSADKMSELFKMPEFDKMFDTAKMPGMDTITAAYEKNMNAMIEANRIAMEGYQSVFKRQVALTEEAVAGAKDKLAALQGQPMSPEQAQKALDEAKTAFEKAVADLKELTEMAQKANTEAFEVIKSRFEEAMGEFKSMMDKAQA